MPNDNEKYYMISRDSMDSLGTAVQAAVAHGDTWIGGVAIDHANRLYIQVMRRG